MKLGRMTDDFLTSGFDKGLTYNANEWYYEQSSRSDIIHTQCGAHCLTSSSGDFSTLVWVHDERQLTLEQWRPQKGTNSKKSLTIFFNY